MKKVAQDYAAELALVNMPPAVLASVETKAIQLGQKEEQQEYYKHIRKRLARQRLQKYNALYKMCTTVCNSAQSFFYNQLEKNDLFLI